MNPEAFFSGLISVLISFAITLGGQKWSCKFVASIKNRLAVRKVGRTKDGNCIFEVDPHILWYQNDSVNLGPGLAFILQEDFKRAVSVSQVESAKKHRQLFLCYGDDNGEALSLLEEVPGPEWSLDYYLGNLVLVAIRKFYFPKSRSRALKRLHDDGRKLRKGRVRTKIAVFPKFWP